VNILKTLNVLILCAMSCKRWQQILLFLIWRLMGLDHGLVSEENCGITDMELYQEVLWMGTWSPSSQ
jgi:hypothetical protein